MSCHAHAHSTSAPPVSSLAPETKNLLQRKCACGGATKLSGSCEACSSKQLEPLTQKKHASFGHDFSKVAVHADSRRPASTGLILTTETTDHQLPPDAAEETGPVDEDSLMDFQGSGTCQNGGAVSGCDPDTGVYDLISNDNTCCTKDCTAQHEAIHKKDHEAWGCCKALGVAAKVKGADKNALIKKYATWRAAVSPITECHAYSNDVTCADALAKAKDCSGKGKGTDCCSDIADYRARYAALAKTNCAAAPKKAPPCPF